MASSSASAAMVQEQEAMAVTQAAAEAFRVRDIAAIEKILAPEFVLVSAAAEVQIRAQAIAEVQATRIPK